MESAQSGTQVQDSFQYRTYRVFKRFELSVLKDCPQGEPCEDIVSIAITRQDSDAPLDIGLRLRALTEALLDDDADQVSIEIEEI